MHVLDDLDVVARAHVFAAAPAAELHIRRVHVLHVALLLLRHPQFLLHYSLNLELGDLMKKRKSLSPLRVFSFTQATNLKANIPVFHSLLVLRI